MSLDQKFSPFDFRFMDFSPIPTLRKHNEFSDSLQISRSEILSSVNTPPLPRLLVLSSYFCCCINMNRQLHTAAVLLSVRPFRPISRSRPLELRPCAGVCAPAGHRYAGLGDSPLEAEALAARTLRSCVRSPSPCPRGSGTFLYN